MLCGVLASGQAQAFDVKGVVGFGYDRGGDKVATASFVGGGTESIRANAGMHFFGGLLLGQNKPGGVSLQTTIGIKYDSIDASNGDLSWTAYPLEALVFYNTQYVRVGLGVSYHLNPELDGDGVAGNVSARFDDSAGFVAQVEYRATSVPFTVGLRYTDIDYSHPLLRNAVDGSGIGLTMSYAFP